MITLYAWVGEDEHGSGEVGLKQAAVPAGIVPLVATAREKISRREIEKQLQLQADRFGKEIRLVVCREVETLLVLKPRPRG